MIAASALLSLLVFHAPDEAPDPIPLILRDREAAATACLQATPPPASAPSSVTLSMSGATLRYVVDDSDARALGPTLVACIERAFAHVPTESSLGRTPNIVTLALDDGEPTRTARVSQARTILGSLDKGQLRGVVRAASPKLKACYEAEIARDAQTLPDRTVMRFVIGADGRVVADSVEQKEPAANAALGACVTDVVRALEFPEPKGGGVVIVTYPFVFKREGAPGTSTAQASDAGAADVTSGVETPVSTKRVRGDERATPPARGCLGLW